MLDNLKVGDKITFVSGLGKNYSEQLTIINIDECWITCSNKKRYNKRSGREFGCTGNFSRYRGIEVRNK